MERVQLSVFPSPVMLGNGESPHLWLLVHFHLRLTVHINAQKNLTQWREGFREIQLLSPNLGEELWKRADKGDNSYWLLRCLFLLQ